MRSRKYGISHDITRRKKAEDEIHRRSTRLSRFPPLRAARGEERLNAILTRTCGLSGAEVCDRLLAEVKAYSGHADFDDDVCLVAIEAR